ncbi:hypothetical protein FAVG1_13118 [Fusarium avenaceum]|nr:hypothetical protein FAVG1_13118 [Fusarium avenaceum]
MHQELEEGFSSIVEANTGLVHFKPSAHEGHTDAIFLNDDRKKNAIVQEMLGEITHIHATGDHSVHVILAPVDCKTVIESGWGQRHPLDGVGLAQLVFGWTIPKQYILLYAPRNKDEIRVVMDIVKASIGFAADSMDVKSVDKSGEPKVFYAGSRWSPDAYLRRSQSMTVGTPHHNEQTLSRSFLIS